MSLDCDVPTNPVTLEICLVSLTLCVLIEGWIQQEREETQERSLVGGAASQGGRKLGREKKRRGFQPANLAIRHCMLKSPCNSTAAALFQPAFIYALANLSDSTPVTLALVSNIERPKYRPSLWNLYPRIKHPCMRRRGSS